MADRTSAPRIYVLAGANGSGKSSIGGAALARAGAGCCNPDEAARLIAAANPGITQAEANSAAWHEGKRLLERAIAERLTYALETTLGGRTITALLDRALDAGIEVRIWYVGLTTPALCIARVRARVAKGGHDIPEAALRRRYNSSRLNLIHLIPRLTELRVYDNSAEADPAAGLAPEPMLILHCARGVVLDACDLRRVPAWAKPLVAAAMAA